jgi:hypothetical protein
MLTLEGRPWPRSGIDIFTLTSSSFGFGCCPKSKFSGVEDLNLDEPGGSMRDIIV